MPTSPPNLNLNLSDAIRHATWTGEWLHALAHDRSISVAALCRELQTPRHLYTEIARKIVRDGERDAEYYVQAKESPPPLTPDASLRLKVCHAHYTRITDAIQAREDEQADRELSRLRSKKA